jgi:hypothetical protein
VEVPPVDERHFDRRAVQLQHGLQAAEPSADHHDAVHADIVNARGRYRDRRPS